MDRTEQEVLQIVHEHLDDVEVDDKIKDASPIRFSVLDESVKRSEYAWWVQVRPSREPRRWHYLYDELAEVGVDISYSTGINIFFTTLDPVNASGIAV